MFRRSRFAAVLAAACVVAGAPGARAACTGFGPGAAYAANDAPQMVASADFDGDGVLDLALANLSGPTLTVLRGLPGGAFGAPVGYAGGTAGRGLAISDFNGDGRADIAVAVSDGVMIWLGVGDGTFVSGGEWIAGSANRAIACGDFDADGIVDLAVTSSSTNAVLVGRGNGANGVGDGTFASPASYATAVAPSRIVAADLDGDGVLDLAVTNNASACIGILRGRAPAGRPDGTFATVALYAAAGSPWGIAVADWNRDGVPDLIVSDGGGTTLTLLRGTGGGAFAAGGSVTTPLAPRDLVVGDFDGDGIADVATACAAANGVAVLHGTGAGFTPLGNFAAGAGATGLVAGDWNGDGAPDLVSADAGGASVTRFLATCPPAISTLTLLAPLGGETWWPGTAQTVRWSATGSVTAVDVDLSRDGGTTWVPLARGVIGDHVQVPAVGLPDPRLRARVRDALVPARAAASTADFTLCAVLSAPLVSDAPLVPAFLAAADLDGDGRLDLVACDATRAVVLRGDGAGRFAPLAPFAADSTRALALADLDGDGRVDLVRLTRAGVAVRAGDGAGNFGSETVRAVANGVALALGDFDADGLPDVAVLAADGANAKLIVWRSGAPDAPWSAAVAGEPHALGTADFDADGILDLAVACGAGVQLWTGGGAAGRGDGTFAAGATSTLPSPPGDLALADLDGDGVTDVLACLPASGDLMQLPVGSPSTAAPGGTLATPLALAAGAAPRQPLVADFDGDGRADVALALGTEHTLALFLRAGDGFAPPLRFAPGACGPALVVGDFTGDGNPDLVCAGTDATVRCLPVQCPPQVAATLAFTARDTSAATVGFTRALAWQRSASVGAVRVELSRDGGAHWSTLAAAVQGDAFAWTVTGPATAAARLRVADAVCGTRFDESPVFAIRTPFGASRATAAPPNALAFACADLDGDGVPDVVCADHAALHVMRGDGALGFVPLADLAEPRVRRVRLADLDADGRPDVVTLDATGVALRRGTGAAFGAPQSLALTGLALDAAVADLDADGHPDLAILCDGTAPHVTVLFGRGLARDGSFAFAYPALVPLLAPPSAFALADLDGDGVLDLLVAGGGSLDVWLGTNVNGVGTGAFRLASRRAFGATVREMVTGDFDGDGRVDVAAIDSAGVLVAAGDGAGGFGAPVAIALPAQAAGAPLIADVDRDGATDFVVPLASGTLALVRGIAGAPFARRFAPAATVATGAGGACALLDADGDGAPDAIALDPAGTLRVLRGGMRAVGAPRLTNALPSAVRVGDALALAWTKPAGVASVDVELSRDGGTRWTALASGVTGTSWRWLVRGLPTGFAKLRVRDELVPAGADTAGAVFAIEPSVTGVGATSPAAAAALRLAGANPMRGAATLALTLPRASRVRVDVCDVGGRRVRVLADGALGAGTHALRWDGRDANGNAVAPGLYFVRARADAFTGSARVVLTR